MCDLIKGVKSCYVEIINTKINLENEKIPLLAITSVVIILLALSAFCYNYKGGKFAGSDPGYNRRYSIGCLITSGIITSATLITYLIRLCKHSINTSVSASSRNI